MRCFGPTLPKDTAWPPNNTAKFGYPKLLMSASTDMGVIDQETDKPFTDPDPIGLNLAAAETFAIFKRYYVNSYQVMNALMVGFLLLTCTFWYCRMARWLAWLPTTASSETSQLPGLTWSQQDTPTHTTPKRASWGL